MRHWTFHPLVFYPAIALIAALVILISLKPQNWPREPAPTAGAVAGGALILERAAFNAPDGSPDQTMTVVRDFWGRPQALRIAVLPGQPDPSPAETGARILLTPESAALLDDKPVAVEVTYRPLPVNAAQSLAVSLQGIGPADWVIQPIPPQPGTVRFQLPPGFAVNAVGLRAVSPGADQAYGVEIVRVRAVPG
jgi:hypothetical protein